MVATIRIPRHLLVSSSVRRLYPTWWFVLEECNCTVVLACREERAVRPRLLEAKRVLILVRAP